MIDSWTSWNEEWHTTVVFNTFFTLWWMLPIFLLLTTEKRITACLFYFGTFSGNVAIINISVFLEMWQ